MALDIVRRDGLDTHGAYLVEDVDDHVLGEEEEIEAKAHRHPAVSQRPLLTESRELLKQPCREHVLVHLQLGLPVLDTANGGVAVDRPDAGRNGCG